jgi:putative addiction module component (TIGR02574 family)
MAREALSTTVGVITMATSLSDLEQQARSLPADYRARLAEVLLESLQGTLSDVEAAWSREIEERVAAYDRGELQTFAAEDVFAEAKRITR